MGRRTSTAFSPLEGLVTLVVILVLFQTFLEDLSLVAQWPWVFRRILVYTGFFFDVFFTVEFTLRLYRSYTEQDIKSYLFKNNGWIDFLASIPLLVLDSGPRLLSVLSQSSYFGSAIGVLAVLRMVRLVRIVRLMRILRILKPLSRLKSEGSNMTNRHVSRIIGLSLCVIVFGSITYTAFENILGFQGSLPILENQVRILSNDFNTQDFSNSAGQEDLNTIARDNPLLLLVRQKGRTVYSRYDIDERKYLFGNSDYAYIESGTTEMYISLVPVHAEAASRGLLLFFLGLGQLLVFTLAYSKHFFKTITEPIEIIDRGLADPTFTQRVTILPEYADDEIFLLAQKYNDTLGSESRDPQW